MEGWRSSPTRLREDGALESDLVASGYRDRLFTELVQNAADAASRAGGAGAVDVQWDGELLSVANTGAPLDESGVRALCALRASDKSEGVGRFGVGFTAVRTVSDEVQVRSSTGSIAFSASRTAAALAGAGLTAPHSGAPALRLAWPSVQLPRNGFATEIVLALRPDVDGDRLVSELVHEAIDLLLELPAVQSITIRSISLGERVIERRERILDSGLTEVRIGERTWWRCDADHAQWLVPVQGRQVRPLAEDVLRAPTRSDEQLSLPAIVIGEVDMQPDRRRILPGAQVQRLAQGYHRLVAAVPAGQRALLIPTPTFARSVVDGELREAVLADLRGSPWLPVVATGVHAVETLVLPHRAHLIVGLSDELAAALTEIVDALVIPDLSTPRNQQLLDAVGVHRIGFARLTELLSGVQREPTWWHALYEALAPLVTDAVVAEELSSIPVPLSDGRIVTGPRTVLLGAEIGGQVVIDWARVVHPDAAHPLLARLGAESATAADLLSDPALAARIEELADWDGNDNDSAATGLVESVLAIAAEHSAGTLPSWLGQLPIPEEGGGLRAADELLLPGAPLAEVLAEDSPFGIVEEEFAERFGARALRVVGVGAGFTTLHADLPSGPDHDLDDEENWWDTLREDPEKIDAVRDLDLVDPTLWPRALSLLIEDPTTRPLLDDANGYTAWWLRRHAELGGVPLGSLRAPDDDTFAGLLDVADHPYAAQLSAALAPSRLDSPEFAELLLDRLADPQRQAEPAVIVRAHRALAKAVHDGELNIDDLDVPAGVRALDGSVADLDAALVLDRPWLAAVISPARLVVGDIDTADALAELLDAALASENVRGVVVGAGRLSRWSAEPGAVLAATLAGAGLPSGPVIVHEQLTVHVDTPEGEYNVEVPWWVDDDGAVHAAARWQLPWNQLAQNQRRGR